MMTAIAAALAGAGHGDTARVSAAVEKEDGGEIASLQQRELHAPYVPSVMVFVAQLARPSVTLGGTLRSRPPRMTSVRVGRWWCLPGFMSSSLGAVIA